MRLLLLIILSIPYWAYSQVVVNENGDDVSNDIKVECVNPVCDSVYVFKNDRQLYFGKKSDTIQIDVLSGYILEDVPIDFVSRTKIDTSVDVISSENISSTQILESQSQTTADVLAQSEEIFIQKSQMGGGSPMMRGFSANRVLLMYDNIRINNAIFRSGNLHNVIVFDPFSLANIAVTYGPSSALFGSDALGGTIHFQTPKAHFSDSVKVHSDVLLKTASMNLEKTFSGNLRISSKRLFSFTAVTVSDYDDLRAGANRSSRYGDFGLREHYVETVDGQDLIRTGNPQDLKYTGYGQFNANQKFSYLLNEKVVLSLSGHMSKSTDIPRYDRLTIDDSLSNPIYAEWNYQPQEWYMTNAQLEVNDSTKLFDELNANIAYQYYIEGRNDRKFQDEWRRERVEQLNIINYYISAQKNFGKNSLTYGVEGDYQNIKSRGKEVNTTTQEERLVASRYPDGSNRTNSIGVFAQYKKQVSDRSLLSLGLRLSYYHLSSQIDSNYYNLPETRTEFMNIVPSGQLNYFFKLNENLVLNSNVTTGYRNPNLDDAAKVFDSEPGNVVVPNNNLKAEYSYNFDLGLLKTSKTSRYKVAGFYTFLDNALIRTDGTLNGSDSIVYDGDLSKVQMLTNGNSAHILGVNVSVNQKFLSDFEFMLRANYIYSHETSTGTTLRHAPPFFGQLKLSYVKKKFQVFASTLFQASRDFDQLAPSEQSKTHIYPTEGAIGYMILNVGGIYKVNKYLKLMGGIDNVTDSFYQPYSSGLPGGGINFKCSLLMNF